MKTTTKNINNIRVMMLAAGEGTRLRPLTAHLPKPLNPILNKPVMEYTLEHLAGQGIKEVMVNISYFPEKIKHYFGDGKKYGLKISYSFEKKALGTAGGIKNVENFFKKNTFIVVSGDGLTDINLARVVDFHKKKKALGTMVLSNEDMKYEYGVVINNAAGRITKFLEKPLWSDVFSSAVNTGIYVFEPEIFGFIPKNKWYDFGMQVWPKLLKKNKKIFAYHTKNYWCDIGDLDVYRRAHRDVMDKRIACAVNGREIEKNIWAGDNLRLAGDVTLIPPCVIGNNCCFESKTVIGPYASIGDNASIGAGSSIKNSVLWDTVSVARGVTVSDSIITNNVELSCINIYIKNAIISRNIN